MMDEGSRHKGSSPESFAAAAEAAVADYESEHGVSDELVTFKVEEMYVRAKHNPIHEYIVMLKRQD
jgi:flavin-binding protein dodecin